MRLPSDGRRDSAAVHPKDSGLKPQLCYGAARVRLFGTL
jgi:hypothetical protein